MRAVVWSKDNCPACTEAKKMLVDRGISYDERIVGFNATKEDLLKEVPNARSVPQVFIDGQYIGGRDQLKEHFEKNIVQNSVELQWGMSPFHN